MSFVLSHAARPLWPWLIFDVGQKSMISLFRDAVGNPYWPSILTFVGWLVAGLIMFAGFGIAKRDRDKAYVEKQKREAELVATHKKVETLESAARPRELSDAQADKIRGALSGAPQVAGVIITSKMLDPEANAFGERISSTVKSAGWQVVHSPMAAAAFRGIRIVTNGAAEDTARILKKAFLDAALEFTEEPVKIEQCPIVHSPAVYVFIGAK